MRCVICDSPYFVGAGDGLCRKCRNTINAANRMNPIRSREDEEELIKSEHKSMNFIDTTLADSYSRKDQF